MSAEVVIVGAGPIGLMLGCEVALCGGRVVILERLPEPSSLPKANGVVGNVVQLLDARGLLERFTPHASLVGAAPAFQFGPVPLALAKFGAKLHGAVLPQRKLEAILEERARELGVEIRRGEAVIGFSEEDDAMVIHIDRPGGAHQLRTQFLVGCDGARSFVRKHAGIGFPGTTSKTVSRIGHVTLPPSLLVPGTGELSLPGTGRIPPGRNRTPRGLFTFISLTPGVHIISVSEVIEGAVVDPDAPMTLEELQEAVRRVLGVDLPLSDPRWLTRNVNNSRQAERYRQGRVFLAGDAAHVFSAGGSALNTGMLDATNLGWKLAATVRGGAPSGLLDSYHHERHPAGARVLVHTRVQEALMEPGVQGEALSGLFGELVQQPETVRHLAATLSGTDVRYQLGDDSHPWIGRWMPEVIPLTRLLVNGRAVLVDSSESGKAAAVAEPWRERIEVLRQPASHPEPPASLLIRPDGYVAWAGGPDSLDASGLKAALVRWFGAAS